MGKIIIKDLITGCFFYGPLACTGAARWDSGDSYLQWGCKRTELGVCEWSAIERTL